MSPTSSVSSSRRPAEVVTRLESPEQVYDTLWSHMRAVLCHIHFVVQPVTASSMRGHGDRHGCRLQVEMFDRAVHPDPKQASAFALRAREAWASGSM